MEDRKLRFEQAVDRHDAEEAMRRINVVFETAYEGACMDVEGGKCRLPLKCVGRGRRPVQVWKRAAPPVVKPARQGHFTPDLTQPNLHVRRRTRQVRRFQSLKAQLRACESREENPNAPCWQLWSSILHAAGFHHGFVAYCLDVHGCNVPEQCPTSHYAGYLAQVLMKDLRVDIDKQKQVDRDRRALQVQADIRDGGGRSYRSAHDRQFCHCNPLNRSCIPGQTTSVAKRWTS